MMIRSKLVESASAVDPATEPEEADEGRLNSDLRGAGGASDDAGTLAAALDLASSVVGSAFFLLR